MTGAGEASPKESPPPRQPLWRRVLRHVWIACVVAAFAIALARQWTSVGQAFARIDGWRLGLSAALGVVGVGVSAQVWRALIGGLGAPLSVTAGARVFFVGQLGKYLPGSVWPVVAQMELGKDYGVARRTSAAAVALFLWVHLCTGVVLAGGLLPFTADVPLVAVLVVPAGMALLLPGVLRRGITLAVRVTRREEIPTLPGFPAVAAAAGWALVMWACYGAHLWLLVEGAGTDVGGVNALSMVGAFAAAWSVGFLFLIAPAGAGAREGVLLALLPLPVGAQLAVVLISRVMLTAADGLWGSFGALAVRARRG